MKTQKLILVGLLLLFSAGTLAAQNALPDPHNDSCWSSLAALRACQLQAYNEAQDHMWRCSSYPEYQCLPEDTYQTPQKTASKHAANGASNAVNVTPTTANTNGVSDTSFQAGATK